MQRLVVPFLPLLLTAGITSSCSLAAHTKGSRDSGQSNLMADSFAGKNACNPENHLRPFIIEWDATDASSFQQHAANDIVFVQYEGCSLRVLDECRNESIRGEQGAYKPTEWTSGALETLDVNNSAELFAKLPLGQATLGGRVEGGEKFHMEYYVSGTITASRDAVYHDDLQGKYGCEKATHFVYGYNLGAFALASSKNLKASAGGSAFGFEAGGSETRESSAEKKGGKLTVCDSASAKEVEGCKAPIRLTLRDIRPGANPEKEAMKAADTPESLAATAVLNAKMEMSEEASARFEAANRKLGAGDGKGCLKELDAHDKLNAKRKSSDPKSGFGFIRAQCVMLAGQCDAGKVMLRKSTEQAPQMKDLGPEHIDRMVESYSSRWCQGKMSDRDTLLKAITALQMGGQNSSFGIKGCSEALATIKKLKGKVKPKDGEDYQLISLDGSLTAYAAGCFGKNGDCKLAMKEMQATFDPGRKKQLESIPDPAIRDKTWNDLLGAYAPKCKKVE